MVTKEEKLILQSRVEGASSTSISSSFLDKEKVLSSNRVQDLIRAECSKVEVMLLEKNRRYGNSALDPIRLMSKSDTVEQLKVRIDDKLKRIQNCTEGDEEDSLMDLVGYLVLLMVARRPDFSLT